MDERVEGGCFCGAVRYAVSAIFDAGYCHCSICRRTSGAPVLAWAHVRAADFELLQGSPKELVTSPRGRRFFCAACGTHLFFRDGRASGEDELVGFHIATLDDPNAVKPRLHVSWRIESPGSTQPTICHAFPTTGFPTPTVAEQKAVRPARSCAQARA